MAKFAVTIELKAEGELSEVMEEIERLSFGMLNLEDAQVCKIGQRHELVRTYYGDGEWENEEQDNA